MFSWFRSSKSESSNSEETSSSKSSSTSSSASSSGAPDEVALLAQLREKVTAAGGDESGKSDDAQLTRLLRAREYNVDDSFNMWLKWMEWRKEYKVDDIKVEEIMDEITSGKAFWCGYDKQNRPILIIRTRYHSPKYSPDVKSLIRFGIWLIEEGIRLCELKGSSQVIIVYDRAGFTLSKNHDKRLMGVAKQLIGIFQNNYAERLYRSYILNVNWFYWVIHKIVSPFLSKKTREKTVILNDTSKLLEFVDAEQLLPEHGGTNQFDWKQEIWDKFKQKPSGLAKEEDEQKEKQDPAAAAAVAAAAAAASSTTTTTLESSGTFTTISSAELDELTEEEKEAVADQLSHSAESSAQ